jgi:O-succinylbenzoate synthase
MKLERLELRRIALDLVTPFRTSFGVETQRDIMLLHVVTDAGDGWGECVASHEPAYSSEFVEGSALVIRDHLWPTVVAAGVSAAADVAPALARFKGHQMSKAALEMAVLDAELRADGISWKERIGGTRDRIPSGVSVGIFDTLDELSRQVAGYIADGYVRIKLKIEPGWDIEPVRMVRDQIGPDVPLQVDANTAYTRDDIAHLCKLDESVVSMQTAVDAIELGAAEIVNIKPGRVGGYLAAVRIHDLCVERGVPVWCGGMVETGIGRAANAGLASLPGFTLPGDISASTRFYARDIVLRPITVEHGHVIVPATPGLGFELDQEFLDSITTSTVVLQP